MHTGVGSSRPARWLVLLLWAIGSVEAAEAERAYPTMAAIAEYRVANRSEEIALARSAAPTSISDNATVLTLGNQGYEQAATGKNEFVCLVMRSWAAEFADAQFWNPKIRAPICLNPSAVRSVLPGYRERTGWILAGVSKPDMLARTQAAVVAKTFAPPESGAMGYMMSKRGFLSDADGHWHPHLMFFLPRTEAAAWGANLTGSPIFAAQSDPEPVTTFFIPVTHWSDGTLAMTEKH